ncbi:ATP-binding protein, partial [Methylobacterium trifolii]
GVRTRTDLRAHVLDLAEALRRLHADRRLAIEADVPEGLVVACDGQDLDEMLGNLMDNACTWAKARVRISAIPLDQGVCLRVEDDGPGLDGDAFAAVMARGRRLDESVPGHGFGLPITLELAELYGGALDLRRSGLGGLRAELRLPA